jgi:hypothetical protein
MADQNVPPPDPFASAEKTPGGTTSTAVKDSNPYLSKSLITTEPVFLGEKDTDDELETS